MKRLTSLLASCALATLAVHTPASAADADDWPTGVVRFVVPFPPGGGTDMIARLLADEMSKKLDGQFIVDNRPGGNTTIAADLVARAAPDGNTFLFTTSPHVIASIMYPENLAYDPETDLVPVIRVAENGMILVANDDAPAKSVDDLIAYAKAHPGEINMATVGTTGMSYLSAVLFAAEADIDIANVPYKGTGQVMPDLIGGQVDYFFDNPGSSIQQVKAGNLHALAYSGSQRLKAMPDVPTVAESGLEGFETVNWYGILAPAGTPDAILAKLETELGEILERPEIVERLEADGVTVINRGRDDYTDYMKADFAKWKAVIDERQLKPE